LTKDKGYEKDPHRLIAKLMTRIPARLKPDTITFDFMMEILINLGKKTTDGFRHRWRIKDLLNTIRFLGSARAALEAIVGAAGGEAGKDLAELVERVVSAINIPLPSIRTLVEHHKTYYR